MKKSIAICSTILFLVVAFWLGEAGKGLFQIYPYLLGFIGAGIVSYLASNKLKHRAIVCLSFIVLYCSAFYVGDLSFYHSFNKCIDEAENIRIVLSEFERTNGKYPNSLAELKIQLPCSRVLRGSLLHYESSGSRYKIWFEDWLIEHSATESEPFTAHK